MLWNKCFLEFKLTVLYTCSFVWNLKETSQLTTALAEWLVPMRYHTELKNQLCDVNFLVRKALYGDFLNLKKFSAKGDKISREK